MKRFKKLFGLTFALLFMVFTVNPVKAAPTSITVSTDGYMYDASTEKPYLIPENPDNDGKYTWAKLKTSDNKIAYCIDLDKTWPSGDSMTVSDGEVSAGLVYILRNGYPHKTIVDGGEKDRYITQGAVWLYMKNSTEFGETLTDTYGLIPYMRNLASAARTSGGSSGNATVDLSISGPEMTQYANYYISPEINVTVSGASTYSVTVTGATGAEAVTTSGTVKTTFNANEKFRVRVPSSVGAGKNITATVKVAGTSYALVPGSNETQRVITLYEDEVSDTKTIQLRTSESVCVNYVIVGNVKPDPAKTDPTPDQWCDKKGTEYDQEKELTTRTNCTFKGWFTKEDLTGKWVDGTALMQDLTLYGAWDCPATVIVPPTAANTPLIILGVGLICVSVCVYYYIRTDGGTKKTNKNKD